MTLGFLTVLLAILATPVASAQEVDPYNLPDGGLYVLEQPELTMRGLWYFQGLDQPVTIFAGSVISIGPRRCENGVLWYEATRLEPGTLDRSRHIEGWIKAADIEEGGLSHFDSMRAPTEPVTPCR